MIDRTPRWLLATLLAAAALALFLALLPFEAVAALADRLAEDGDAAPFGRALHGALQSLAGLLALFFSAAAVAARVGWARVPAAHRDSALYAATSTFLVVLCTWYLYYLPYPTGYDVWHHMAAIKALARPQWSHPFFDTLDPHLFASPYHLLWGRLLQALDGVASIFDLTIAAGVLNLLLVLSGLFYFLGLFLPGRGRFLCLLLLLGLAGFGGIKGDFRWFTLHEIATRLPYPSRFAIGASFWLLWWTEVGLRRERPWRLVAVAPAAAVVLLCHPFSAVLLFVGLTVTTALRATRREWKTGLGLAVVLLSALLLALAWPLFPLLELATGKAAELNRSNWLMIYGTGSSAVATYWPQIVFGLPAGAYLALAAWRRRDPARTWLALTTATLGALVLLGSVPRLGALARTIGPLTFLLDVCLAIALIDLWKRLPTASPLRRRAPWIALLLLVLWVPYFVAANGPAVRKRWLRGVAGGVRLDLDRELGFLADRVEPGQVVLADLDTSFKVPAFCEGKVVASPHPLAFVDDAAQRREAVRHFFAPDATRAERRAIVRSYGVDLLLLDTTLEGAATLAGEVGFEEIGGPGRFRLYAPRQAPRP
ncbi:MAG: hypothetical protein R3325_11400 [Thermoanaerobaculia bacterium]|nr:hypothetical protein [Thermoanaerobaculia bacterium]